MPATSLFANGDGKTRQSLLLQARSTATKEPCGFGPISEVDGRHSPISSRWDRGPLRVQTLLELSGMDQRGTSCGLRTGTAGPSARPRWSQPGIPLASRDADSLPGQFPLPDLGTSYQDRERSAVHPNDPNPRRPISWICLKVASTQRRCDPRDDRRPPRLAGAAPQLRENEPAKPDRPVPQPGLFRNSGRVQIG